MLLLLPFLFVAMDLDPVVAADATSPAVSFCCYGSRSCCWCWCHCSCCFFLLPWIQNGWAVCLLYLAAPGVTITPASSQHSLHSHGGTAANKFNFSVTCDLGPNFHEGWRISLKRISSWNNYTSLRRGYCCRLYDGLWSLSAYADSSTPRVKAGSTEGQRVRRWASAEPALDGREPFQCVDRL